MLLIYYTMVTIYNTIITFLKYNLARRSIYKVNIKKKNYHFSSKQIISVKIVIIRNIFLV